MSVIEKIGFAGLRKLNWEEFPRGSGKPGEHIISSGIEFPLELSRINIVIGPNGGGKTTFLDIFRSLKEPLLLGSLSRENYPGEDFSFFEIWFGGRSIRCVFSRFLPEGHGDNTLTEQFLEIAPFEYGVRVEEGRTAILRKDGRHNSGSRALCKYVKEVGAI